jgi:hypothetical protein
MSRGPGKALYSGKQYSSYEENLIFLWVIRVPNYLWLLAKMIGHTEDEIWHVWRRICRNASAFADQKPRILRPPSNKPWLHINGFAQEYIEEQIFEVEKKSTPEKIHKETAIPTEKIRDRIKVLKIKRRTSDEKGLLDVSS